MTHRKRMTLITCAAVVLSGIAAHHVLAGMVGSGTVYTVGDVVGGLMQHPRRWDGRTVTVRGFLEMVRFGACGATSSCGYAWCSGAPSCPSMVPAGISVHFYLTQAAIPSSPAGGGSGVFAPMSMASMGCAGAGGCVLPWRPSAANSTLVVLVPARRVHAPLGGLYPLAQGIVDSLPQSVKWTLYRSPTLAQWLQPGPTVQSNRPRLYRVRLLPTPPHHTASWSSCVPACDNAVLVDNL